MFFSFITIGRGQNTQKSVWIDIAEYIPVFRNKELLSPAESIHVTCSTHRTSVNTWKYKFKSSSDDNAVFKETGRPNALDDHWLNKVKDIAIGTCMAGAVINRQQIISIDKGVVRAK